MKKETHEELDRICTVICDKICHWPHVLTDQQDMDDKCAACQPLLDLANFLEAKDAEMERLRKFENTILIDHANRYTERGVRGLLEQIETLKQVCLEHQAERVNLEAEIERLRDADTIERLTRALADKTAERDAAVEEIHAFVCEEMNLHTLEKSLILQPVLNRIYTMRKRWRGLQRKEQP